MAYKKLKPIKMQPTDLPLRFESTACSREKKKTSEMKVYHNLYSIQNYTLSVINSTLLYRRIHADVIVYIFAHLHTALPTEGNLLDKN